MGLFPRSRTPVDPGVLRRHRAIRHVALALLALLAAARLAAQPQAPDPAARLYETHCVTCHTEQVHWRDRRLATDWDGLRAQVRRWQDVQGLHWSEDDVTAVARLLNDRYYGFVPPSSAPGRPAGAPAVHTP